MKNLIVAALLLSSPAFAQFHPIRVDSKTARPPQISRRLGATPLQFPPLQIYPGASATPDPIKFKLRMSTGATCAPGAGADADKEVCTFAGGGGGGVTSAIAGTGVSVSGATGDVTFSLNNAVAALLSGVQIFTGAKTFNAATLLINNAGNTFATTLATAATAARVWTLPDATDTACGLAAAQTLTNKTIVAGSNTISGITSAMLTNIGTGAGSCTNCSITFDAQGRETAYSSGAAAGDMVLASVQTNTGAKTFQNATLLVDNAANTFATTVLSLATQARNWTLPDAADTAVGKATTDTLTNKTLTAPVINGFTSSGSTAMDASGNTGTWSPPTGGLAAALKLANDNAATTDIGDGTHRVRKLWAIAVDSNASAMTIGPSGGTSLNFTYFNGTHFTFQTDSFFATSDNTHTSGSTFDRWSKTFSYQYVGVAQTVTGSGAKTVDPTAGEQYKLLANGNVSGITITAGDKAQRITLTLVQDAAGTSTWPTTFTNARIAGGAFTKTLTANAVDTISFIYNSTDSKWDEVGRATAIQ